MGQSASLERQPCRLLFLVNQKLTAVSAVGGIMQRLNADALSEIIGLIYQGPLEPLPWASSLRWLTRHLNFSWAVLVLRPASKEQPSLIIQANERDVAVATADYILFERYSADPFANLPLNQIITPEELLGAEQWYSHSFFKQYLQPDDIHYELGADFRSNQHAECRLRICRPLRSGPYTADERRFCQLLVPHFQRAVELHSRLYVTEAERQLYAGSFDHLGVGTIILDERGAVLTVSDAARDILAQQANLNVEGNLLTARRKETAGELDAAIAQALRNTSTAPSINALSIKSTTQPGAELRLLVKSVPRLQRVEGQRRPAVAIFLRDSRRTIEPSADVLRMLFDLTAAEANFARLLASGLSMDEAGEQLGITKNTCKSRLKAIFAKTGVTRQAALVGVLHDTLVSL